MEDELQTQLNLLSAFRPSQIFASFVFGVIGIYLFRHGKKKADYKLIAISIVLMAYTLFTPNWLLDWGGGLALCVTAYYFEKNP